MLSIFSWIRRRVAEAFLSGVQDAVEALETNDTGDSPIITLPATLRLRLALPEPEEGNGRKGKVRS